VYSFNHWLRPRDPPPPQHLGSYTRALLVSQERRRHLFVTLLGLTVVSVVDPQTILLALNQLPVHGDLHVQRRLRLQQGLKECHCSTLCCSRVFMNARFQALTLKKPGCVTLYCRCVPIVQGFKGSERMPEPKSLFQQSSRQKYKF
jgi:hypothetical protein